MPFKDPKCNAGLWVGKREEWDQGPKNTMFRDAERFELLRLLKRAQNVLRSSFEAQ